MALDDAAADACGDAIIAAIDAMSVDDRKNHQAKIWHTVMRQIFASIRANANVNVTNVTGVSTGGGISGPGTGTIS